MSETEFAELTPLACTGLTSINDNSCTPLLSYPDTEYRFKLQHVCADDRLSSPWSVFSDWEKTLPIFPPEIAFTLPTGIITERPESVLVLMNAETNLAPQPPPIRMYP